MEQKNEVTVSRPQASLSIFDNENDFNFGMRMAKVFATSNLVPVQYQNNIGNVMIAINMSSRMKADPLMVMQNLVIVHNTPSFEAKFMIACFNATGKYTPIRYKQIGEKGKDSFGYIAYAIDKKTGDVLEGPSVSIKTAKDEGWYDKNNKWKTIPDLMLRYRSASWFIRTTDPGVAMGFQSREEMQDMYGDYIEPEKPEIKEEMDVKDEVEKNANKEAIDIECEKEEDKNSEKSSIDPIPEEEKSEKKEKSNTDREKPLGKAQVPDMFK